MSQVPSIGRIVHYKLSEQDAAATNARRSDWRKGAPAGTGEQAHVGNWVAAGDVYPAMIVRVWRATAEASVQLQVFLDGNDTLWATSVSHAETVCSYTHDNPHPERTFIWPPRI